MSENAPLDVIILNWNAAADTVVCLESISTWQLIRTRPWVVDNASEDDSVARILQKYPDVRLIQSARNRGFAGGNNLAVSDALALGCQELLLLNNDASIAEADVCLLLETLRSDTQLGIVGPTVWDSDRRHILLSAGGTDMARNIVSHVRAASTDGRVRYVDYVPGVCVLVRAKVFRTVGMLDEDYFFGGELADLCERARQRGFASAVDDRARAFHRVDRSSDLRDSLHIYYVFRNRFLYVRKFHRYKKWPLFARWTAYGVYAAAMSARRRKWLRTRSILMGVADGLRGRYGGQNERVLGLMPSRAGRA